MSQSYDAVIVGAGIVGAACAYEFTRAGMRVAVVEGGVVAGDATAAGMGHIVVMDDSPAQFALTRSSQLLWQELAPSLPANVEYDRCGTLWVARDDEEMQAIERRYDACLNNGLPARILNSEALAKAEPHLRAPLAGALLIPEDAVLYPPAAANCLLSRARESGAELHIGKQTERIGQGTVQLAGDMVLRAQFIVNAAGASAGRLTPNLPLRKRKGHLVITDRYPNLFHHQILELGYLKSAHAAEQDSVAFNLQPRPTGQLLLGSSRQFDVEDPAVDHAIVRAMILRAQEYAPVLGSFSALRIWTGFRAATPDHLPLIGPTQDDPTVLLATGHEGLGITTAPATARLLLSYCLGRAAEIPPEPYLPSRFSIGTIHA